MGPAMRLELKRCYLPYVIVSVCPKCGTTVHTNLKQNYLSYPPVGEPFTFTMYHVCVDTTDKLEESEWEVTMSLHVELRAVAGCTIDPSGVSS